MSWRSRLEDTHDSNELVAIDVTVTCADEGAAWDVFYEVGDLLDAAISDLDRTPLQVTATPDGAAITTRLSVWVKRISADDPDRVREHYYDTPVREVAAALSPLLCGGRGVVAVNATPDI